MNTQTYKTIRVYTAQELKDEHPKAFEHAYYNYTGNGYYNPLDMCDVECILDFRQLKIVSANFKDCNYSIGGHDSYFCFDYRHIELDYDGYLKDKLTAKEYSRLKRLALVYGYNGSIDAFFGVVDASSYYRRSHKLAVECEGKPWGLSDYNRNIIKTCEDYLTEHIEYINDLVSSYLEADYEYHNSYEYFIEMANGNEWQFDSKGNLI